MEFGESLKKAREEKGMTQQTLADQLYVTRQAVSRWECGARYPDLMTTKCISNILGVSIDSLLSEDELKNFSERTALMDGQKASKVMTSIYSVTALCCLIHLVSNIANFIWAIQDSIESISPMFTILIMTEIMYLAVFTIAVTCIVKSLKKEIDAKYAGLVGLLFFGIKEVYNLMVNFINGHFTAASVLIPVLGIIFAAIIGFFFLGRKNKLAKVVTIGGILAIFYQVIVVIYQEGNFFINGQWEYFTQTFMSSLLGLFTEVAIVGLMVAQATILEKRRMRQEKL